MKTILSTDNDDSAKPLYDSNIFVVDLYKNEKRSRRELLTQVTVDSKVPQGKVLDPLLFPCHINDLPDGVKTRGYQQIVWKIWKT